MVVTKKISAVIPSDIFSQIEDDGNTPTEAVNVALKFYFEKRSQIISDNLRLKELEEEIIKLKVGKEYLERIITNLESELAILKNELTIAHQKFDTHVLQTQTLINHNQKLLNSQNNKKFWEFWK